MRELPSKRNSKWSVPQFTDYGFIALGVPRNPEIPANRDPRFFDLGLCGPQRTDFAGRTEYCGLFRTPSLRNVTRRHRYFHNGVARSLKEVLRFYVERDARPGKWFPRAANGTVARFNDLPSPYHSNVYTDPPFSRGQPALTDAEIGDVIAFLGTLTDGYRPPVRGSSSVGGADFRQNLRQFAQPFECSGTGEKGAKRRQEWSSNRHLCSVP